MPKLTITYKAASAEDFSEFLVSPKELKDDAENKGYSIIDINDTSVSVEKEFPDKESIEVDAAKIEKALSMMGQHFSNQLADIIPEGHEFFPSEQEHDDRGTKFTIFINPPAI